MFSTSFSTRHILCSYCVYIFSVLLCLHILCSYCVYIFSVLTVSTYSLFLLCLHILCSYCVYIFSVLTVSTYSLFLLCLHILCSYCVYIFSVLTVSTYSLFLLCLHILCSYCPTIPLLFSDFLSDEFSVVTGASYNGLSQSALTPSLQLSAVCSGLDPECRGWVRKKLESG